MPLNTVKIGLIAQNEFAKLLMIGSDGLLEISSPMTDDERRDAEVHIHGEFGLALAFQIKCATRLRTYHRIARLEITFRVKADRLISHPRFLYYCAGLSLSTAGFMDPQFLVDSTKLHKHAGPVLRDNLWRFSFRADMAEKARDMWVPDRVHGLDVASRVLQRMRDLEKLPTAERALPDLSQVPGLVLVRRRVR